MSDIDRTIEAVRRIESTCLIAAIARVIREISLAEELAQDALVAAFEQWPEVGIPEKPAAKLMTAAKRRAIHDLRRGQNKNFLESCRIPICPSVVKVKAGN